LVKELEQLEKKLAGWQGEKKLLDARLADPGLYSGVQTAQLQTLLKRQGELSGWIDDGEMRWLEISEALESLPAE
jgi:ATP-binding cassette subfamily F protein 3